MSRPFICWGKFIRKEYAEPRITDKSRWCIRGMNKRPRLRAAKIDRLPGYSRLADDHSGFNQTSSAVPSPQWADLQYRWTWNGRSAPTLHDSHRRGNAFARVRSVLPGAFAFHARTFHEDYNVHSLGCGFSGRTTRGRRGLKFTTHLAGFGHSPQDGAVSPTGGNFFSER